MKNATLPLYIAFALMSCPVYASQANTNDDTSVPENRTITSQDNQVPPPDAESQRNPPETSKKRRGMRVDNRSQSDPSFLSGSQKTCPQKKTPKK